MKKAEIIKRHGEEAWQKHLAQQRAYYKAHREEDNARSKKYREENPEKEKAHNHEGSRKGGRRYDKQLKYQHTGLRGDRTAIRRKHAHQYKPYKDIIAPDSQIHHEWVPQTDEYRGVALVEKEQHQYGIVDVIQILDGEITLLTEEEIRKGKKNEKEDI
jgi:hypothetical protein